GRARGLPGEREGLRRRLWARRIAAAGEEHLLLGAGRVPGRGEIGALDGEAAGALESVAGGIVDLDRALEGPARGAAADPDTSVGGAHRGVAGARVVQGSRRGDELRGRRVVELRGRERRARGGVLSPDEEH